jgi:L-Ala-D/L-Glu epimerase
VRSVATVTTGSVASRRAVLQSPWLTERRVTERIMRLEERILELRTRHAFHIARAAAPPVRRTVWLRLIGDDGSEGWGEAAGNAYYGESADTIVTLLPLFREILDGLPEDDPLAIDHIERAVDARIRGNPAARAALSAALHDRAGRRLGVPVWRLWGLDAAVAPPSSFTIGIDSPDAIRSRLDEAAAYPILKVKVGAADDRRVLELIRRQLPDHVIRVDANTAWTATQAIAMLPFFQEMGVEFIEQPLAPDDYDGMRRLRDRSTIPIVADESCRVAADVPRLAGCVDGVNIKLEKCGSLREAIRIVHVARAHQLKVMVGCMLSSTLAIAAAIQIAPLADWVDLDGAALLDADPFTGPGLRADGSLRFNDEPGLGVIAR